MKKLTSTTKPGKGFGAFALPIFLEDAMRSLIAGTPIEIPVYTLPNLLRQIGEYCQGDFHVASDYFIAQITPGEMSFTKRGAAFFKS